MALSWGVDGQGFSHSSFLFSRPPSLGYFQNLKYLARPPTCQKIRAKPFFSRRTSWYFIFLPFPWVR